MDDCLLLIFFKVTTVETIGILQFLLKDEI